MPVVSIARKDLRILFRDRSALVFIFGLPLIFTMIFGLIFSGQGKEGDKIKVLVVNQDAGPHGAELIAAMDNVGLKATTARGGLDSVNQSINKGDYALGVIIPGAYSAELEQAVAAIIGNKESVQQARLDFREDPAQAQVAAMAKGALAGAAVKASAPLYRSTIRKIWGDAAAGGAGAGSGQSPITIKESQVEKRAPLSPGDLFIPGFAVYFVFFMANGVAATLLLERQEGTLKRMLTAPISRSQILFGKMLARAFIGLIQTAILFSIGKVTLHLSLTVNELPGLALTAVTTVFAATGLGLLIATFGKTMEQIQGMTTLVLLLMGLISGCLVPRQFFPETLQKISYITPHAWALNAYQDLLLRHTSLVATLGNIGMVVVFGIGFYGLALARFRFE